MAPLNPNNTARLKVIYQNSEAEHTAVIRYTGPGGLTEAQSLFESITDALATLFHFSEVTAVQNAAVLSDIFLDVPASALVGHTWGADPATEESNSTALTFVGRSSGGRRARFSLFGYKGGLSEFRLTSAENEPVENTITLLESAGDSFFAVDGLDPIWKNYANVKAFDHWVDVSRNG